jgi:hypothetical protein
MLGSDQAINWPGRGLADTAWDVFPPSAVGQPATEASFSQHFHLRNSLFRFSGPLLVTAHLLPLPLMIGARGWIAAPHGPNWLVLLDQCRLNASVIRQGIFGPRLSTEIINSRITLKICALIRLG